MNLRLLRNREKANVVGALARRKMVRKVQRDEKTQTKE